MNTIDNNQDVMDSRDVIERLEEVWIVQGEVTSLEAHPTASLGDIEWQFSDGEAGKRGSSSDYLNLEEGLKAHSGYIIHWSQYND